MARKGRFENGRKIQNSSKNEKLRSPKMAQLSIKTSSFPVNQTFCHLKGFLRTKQSRNEETVNDPNAANTKYSFFLEFI